MTFPIVCFVVSCCIFIILRPAKTIYMAWFFFNVRFCFSPTGIRTVIYTVWTYHIAGNIWRAKLIANYVFLIHEGFARCVNQTNLWFQCSMIIFSQSCYYLQNSQMFHPSKIFTSIGTFVFHHFLLIALGVDSR